MNWSTNIYLKQNWINEKITLDRYKQINTSIRFSSKSFNSKEKEDKYQDFMKTIITNVIYIIKLLILKVLMNLWLNFQEEQNI